MRAITVTAVAVLVTGCLGDLDARRSYGYRDEYSTTPGMGSSSQPSASGGLPIGPEPEFGTTVRLGDPPPPISGGTLAIAKDGSVAIASDPDRDAVYVVDLGTRTVRTIQLFAHDEPGRVAFDGSGRAHVALRRGGALATIDVKTATLKERRSICALPRGIAWNAATDVLHVACAGGELVTLPAAGDGPAGASSMFAATSVVDVADDLRDVAVTKDGLVVTTFRRAEVLTLDSEYRIMSVSAPKIGTASSRVAWRMIVAPPTAIGRPEEVVVVAAQSAPDTEAPLPRAYYGGGSCATTGPVTVLRYGKSSIQVPEAVLPVDVAVSGGLAAVVSAGSGHTPSLDSIQLVSLYPTPFGCALGRGVQLKAQVTAVAFVPDGKTLVAQSREPALLFLIDAGSGAVIRTIDLATSSREDTGHAIFHANSGAGIACASCHPEGRDDSHVWRSTSEGALRTPSLAGTTRGTAPYHWRGEAADMHALAKLTFTSRMRGPLLSTERTDALGDWLGALPPLTATVRDATRAARGQALFAGAGRCTTCHAGTARTNNATVDIGTGGKFQVPSLVNVGFRAPYLHDCRAPKLEAIPFATHAGASLTAGEVDDLASYLRTL